MTTEGVILGLLVVIVFVWSVMTLVSSFDPAAKPDGTLVAGISGFLAAAGTFLLSRTWKRNGE